jgi:hypothetical protein
VTIAADERSPESPVRSTGPLAGRRSDAPGITGVPELRHGYTLDTLTRLAHYAARHGQWDRGIGLPARYEAAWAAIAEHLYSSAELPTPGELIRAGWALAQIWPRLTPATRDALTALATYDDYQRAAESLGLSYATFKSRISEGRRQFLALWHEGETPSRPWLRDRRAGPGTDMHTVTYFLRSRRLRRAAEVNDDQP